MAVARGERIDRYALLGLAIRTLSQRGVPLVITSRAGGFDFEMNGKRVSESHVLVRASTHDTTLLEHLWEEQINDFGLAA